MSILDTFFTIKNHIFRFIQFIFKAYLINPPSIYKFKFRSYTFLKNQKVKHLDLFHMNFFAVYKENLSKYGHDIVSLQKSYLDVHLIETTKEGYINYVRS